MNKLVAPHLRDSIIKVLKRLKPNSFKGLVEDSFKIKEIIKDKDMTNTILAMRDGLSKNNMETYEYMMFINGSLFPNGQLERA